MVYVTHPNPRIKSGIGIDPRRVRSVVASTVIYRGGERVRTGASREELLTVLRAAGRRDL